ncbi:MAG: tRNA1(Val) (adenine(37)-N6)-methyltransferase [Methyloceanibacter sp.]|uniref:tRNA1(Val) (adenine(37)-N6)-methyltransferase n=1 Tax=Methyloceanibacter sp. TaxID=1965321 RepID=UPI003D6D4AB9
MISPATSKPDRPKGGTTTDDFLGGRIAIEQPKAGHRAGSDAVFLAAAVEARVGESVLDAGAGVGVAGLCLLARLPRLAVTAVEIDPRLCALAASNAARNGLADRFTVIVADVAARAAVLRAAGLVPAAYDHVIANPPFHTEGEVRAAPEPSRAMAHVMGQGGLAAWVRFLAAMAAPKGTMTMIHRPECLGALLGLLEGRFGDVAVFPLFPKADASATRIIVRGRKGSRAAPRLLPGLVLHGPGGDYTAEAEAVLRGGEALWLASDKRKGRRLGG